MVELSVAATGGGLKIVDKSYTATPNVVLDANGYVIVEVKFGAVAFKLTVKNNDTAETYSFIIAYQPLDAAGNVVYEAWRSYSVPPTGSYTVSYTQPTPIGFIRIVVKDVNNTGQLVLESVSVSAFELEV